MRLRQLAGMKIPGAHASAALGLAALLAACTSPEAGPPVGVAELPILTDARGMTLYTLNDDPPGETTCYAKCAQSWPPLLAEPGDAPRGNYSVVSRTDGTRQWAYLGKPLYTWKKDKAPGEIGGHNIGENWLVARP